MAEKKAKTIPVETADQKLAEAKAREIAVETAVNLPGVKRVLKPDHLGNMYAACGNCGCRLVNVEERVKCRFCWYCGVPIIWK